VSASLTETTSTAQQAHSSTKSAALAKSRLVSRKIVTPVHFLPGTRNLAPANAPSTVTRLASIPLLSMEHVSVRVAQHQHQTVLSQVHPGHGILLTADATARPPTPMVRTSARTDSGISKLALASKAHATVRSVKLMSYLTKKTSASANSAERNLTTLTAQILSTQTAYGSGTLRTARATADSNMT
jgi:hypothetical protein